MQQHRYFFFITAALLIIGCGNSTEQKQTEKKPAAETPKEVSTAGNAEAGKAQYATCIACHGQNGEGVKALNAPALAGQEIYYVVQQLNNFKSDLRGSHSDDAFGAQMAPMAKILATDEAVANVAAYISSLPEVKPEITIEGNVENGENYYNMICGACHGNGAVGIEALFSPKLNGIQDWYLERQINNFRTGIRGAAEGDERGAQMHQIATAIPDDQTVKDVIAYINSLQAE